MHLQLERPVRVEVTPCPKRLRNSVCVLAMAAFLLLNTLALLVFIKSKKEYGEDFAAVALTKGGARPNLVFAGSSNALFPLYMLDKERGLEKDVIERYSTVHTVTEMLERDGINGVLAKNISSLGFMLSDDYFLVDKYLDGSTKPDCLVLMVAPRDFSDALFPSPANGIAFRQLSDAKEFYKFAVNYLPEWNDKFEFLAGRLIFLFANRAKIQDKVHARITHITPSMNRKPEAQMAKSLREYSKRYGAMSPESMERQFPFLESTLSLCKKRGIDVILVCMPLTQDNRRLLPQECLTYYQKRTNEIARRNGITTFDFTTSSDFALADFWDSVHLNGKGAEKTLKKIMPRLQTTLRPVMEQGR